MPKKVALVTGGAGFIGSHMVDLLLRQDYEVRVLDNLSGGHESNLSHHSNEPNLVFEKSDILHVQPSNTLFKNVDVIFHFAGIGDIVPSIEKPLDYMNVNVQGTANILECARDRSIPRFVYAASSSCYGLASTPTEETHAINPKYPYALSKYLGEQVAFHWQKVYGTSVTSVRIFNAYGPRVRTTGAYGAVFGVFFKQKLEKKPFTVVGDGSQSRDFLYVTDVATAFLSASKKIASGEVFNLGADNPQTINRLIELLGGGKTVFIPKRPGEPDCTWANTTKIKERFGWKPIVSFEEGINNMLIDIDRWKDAPLWNKESIKEATKSWFKYVGQKN